MPKYRVYIDQTVQSYIDVEAHNQEAAEMETENWPALPGLVEYSRLRPELREDLTEEIHGEEGS